MAEAPMIGEIHDRVSIFQENIQVWQGPAHGPPEHRLSANSFAQHGLTNGGT
jgi:hypothetical protein